MLELKVSSGLHRSRLLRRRCRRGGPIERLHESDRVRDGDDNAYQCGGWHGVIHHGRTRRRIRSGARDAVRWRAAVCCSRVEAHRAHRAVRPRWVGINVATLGTEAPYDVADARLSAGELVVLQVPAQRGGASASTESVR